MKKIVLLTVLLLMLITLQAQALYTADDYWSARTYLGAQNKNLDPMYLHMTDAANSGNLQTGTGKTFYVDSGVANEGNGTSWTRAKDTLDEAINLCLANRGDFILVAQGHAESGSAADLWDADIAGITIIHLGNGALQGTYTFADTDTTVAIGAANVTIIGGRFLAGISAVVVGIDIEDGSDDCALIGLQFPEPATSSWEFIRAIINTTSDRLIVSGCTAYSADEDGATNFLDLDGGVINGLTFTNNTVIGDYDEGIIHSDDVDLEQIVAWNTLTNLDAGEHCIEYSANATGQCYNNTLQTDVITTALDNGVMSSHGNTWSTPTADVEAVPVNPIIDAVTNLIGVDDSSNLGVTTNVTADADGSILERLEQIDVDTSAIQLIQEGVATKVLTTIMSGDNDIFVVAGGPVKILELIGIVTTQLEAKGNLINYNMDPTSPAGDTEFATDGTALEVTGDLVGTLYVWDGIINNDLTEWANGVALGTPAPTDGSTDKSGGLIVPIGSLELAAVVATSATGEITFYIRYMPLVAGATVTAAP